MIDDIICSDKNDGLVMEVEDLDNMIDDIICSDKNDGLVMEVEDLDYMNDDPSSVDVLYAKVKTEDNR